jgi:two-component system, NarL family, invasion response regulator UvrY
MINVLITDDHPIVRQGLRELLEDDKYKRFGIVEEAGNGKEMFEKLGSFDFDIVLLDLSLPGRGGLELIEDIRKLKPGLPILIISTYPEEQYALTITRLGASGYLKKTSAPGEILNAILKVSQGFKFFNNSHYEKMIDYDPSNHDKSYMEILSAREIEVISLLGSGKTLSAIANELSLSPKTISTYRARILLKLGLNTTADIIKFAITEGLV